MPQVYMMTEHREYGQDVSSPMLDCLIVAEDNDQVYACYSKNVFEGCWAEDVGLTREEIIDAHGDERLIYRSSLQYSAPLYIHRWTDLGQMTEEQIAAFRAVATVYVYQDPDEIED